MSDHHWKLHEILRASTVSVQRPFFRNVTAPTACGNRDGRAAWQ
ncbi:unnamed protein product [Mycetohabitans rhizoxinica HKI 454]|uniref:Uncharacterized protein n=1 Tax=Mycetohabitans rhizoxinica (strain DSM 19002 / CIP 109453 / HKI 454) TaxID=882378 RepID=E5ASD8_MYCRK|nr:unnamed protein product [Mycetohabitans rhizoxinica HKI 454]